MFDNFLSYQSFLTILSSPWWDIEGSSSFLTSIFGYSIHGIAFVVLYYVFGYKNVKSQPQQAFTARSFPKLNPAPHTLNR